MTRVEIVTQLYAGTLAIPGGHHGSNPLEVKQTVLMLCDVADEIIKACTPQGPSWEFVPNPPGSTL